MMRTWHVASALDGLRADHKKARRGETSRRARPALFPDRQMPV